MNKLDQLWAEVNALGGILDSDKDEYGRGINETVGVVLDMIEKLGGVDPALREQNAYVADPFRLILGHFRGRHSA